MTPEQMHKDAEGRMQKSLDSLAHEMKGLRTGRATPALLDAIRVEQYGSPTPIKAVANVTTPEPQQILIKPFDPAALKDIEKAIRGSDLGLSPNSDGKVIRLQIPPMSGEQRTKMAKKIKELAENAKISCRNIRRDTNKAIDTAEKAGTLSEDVAAKAKDKVQALLKTFEDRVQDAADKKTKEVQEQ